MEMRLLFGAVIVALAVRMAACGKEAAREPYRGYRTPANELLIGPSAEEGKFRLYNVANGSARGYIRQTAGRPGGTGGRRLSGAGGGSDVPEVPVGGRQVDPQDRGAGRIENRERRITGWHPDFLRTEAEWMARVAGVGAARWCTPLRLRLAEAGRGDAHEPMAALDFAMVPVG